MPIPRFFVPGPLAAGSELRLEDNAARHALKVLRLRRGAPVTIFDGSGGEYRAELIDTGRQAHVRLLELVEVERESMLSVRLVQGLSRGERMDFTIQKATELGVQEIRPVFTERSVIRLDPARAEKKRQHWQAVAQSACEQCGRNRVPGVALPAPLHEVLAASTGERLVLDPSAGRGLRELATRPAGSVSLLCGPEGGLSEGELSVARESGWRAVHLGPRVLRTETIAIAGLAALQALWGDLG
ncbi:MAG: 16S rRNA (uracil(1498)-N(3))-methyltransferase [Gammaproteobacteria bacterium]